MILFLGDIHGNFNYIKSEILRKKITDCTIIQVGDFGIGFTSIENDTRILKEFDAFLNVVNITMYVIRGNHDNPKFFNGNFQYENLKLLEDYSILELEGKKILLVGGAVSVDRVPRLDEMKKLARYGNKKEQYWFDEKFVLNEDKVKDLTDINIVVTHTAPNWCDPDNSNGFGDFVESYAFYDKNLLNDLSNERKDVTKMFDIVMKNNNIEKIYYGHFHRSSVSKKDNTTAHLLNCNEFMMI